MEEIKGGDFYKELYEELFRLSKEVGKILREKKQTISLAESCTGGLLSHIITEVPGSSDYFILGVTSYSNFAKMELLGVEEETLKKYGAVSSECVMEMAMGVKELAESDWAISISGIAGPTGGSPQKPVGLVYFCVATPKDRVIVAKEEFGEDKHRSLIKLLSCKQALLLLKENLYKE